MTDTTNSHPNIMTDLRGYNSPNAMVDMRNTQRYATYRADSEIAERQAAFAQAEQYAFSGGPAPDYVGPDTQITVDTADQAELFRLRDVGMYGELLLFLAAPHTRQARADILVRDLGNAASYRLQVRHSSAKPKDDNRYERLLAKRAPNTFLDTEAGNAELIGVCVDKAKGLKAEDLPLLLQVIDEGTLAQQALIKQHTPLVLFTSKTFRHAQRLPLDLRLSAGYEGLKRSVRNYDPADGFTFATYAVKTIAGEIMKAAALAASQQLGTTPARLERIRKMQYVTSQLVQELGRNPSDTEVAERMGVLLRSVEKYKRIVAQGTPLRAYTSDKDPHDTTDFIPDLTDKQGESVAQSMAETHDYLSELLPQVFLAANLNSDEQRVLRGIFGITSEGEQTADALAAALGQSVAKIQNIERSARKKIRHSLQAATLLHQYLKRSS